MTPAWPPRGVAVTETDRVAELEARIAQLEGRTGERPSDGPVPSPMDRRALLRRGGVALAGAVGLAATPMLARPAFAANGSAVTIGAANSGTSQTGLTADQSAATLALANSYYTQENQGGSAVPIAGAPLNVTPTAPPGQPPPVGPSISTAQSGDLLSAGGVLFYTHLAPPQAAQAISGVVYTSAFANLTVPVTPFRALDTRQTNHVGGNYGRTLIVNTAPSAFAPNGQLGAGQTLTINLAAFVFNGYAVIGNLTIVSPLAGGYATAFPPGTRPATSSVNYTAGAIVANFLLSPLGPNTDQLSIYTVQQAHILFDVTAFIVADVVDVNPSVAAPLAAARATGSPSSRTAPAWRAPTSASRPLVAR